MSESERSPDKAYEPKVTDLVYSFIKGYDSLEITSAVNGDYKRRSESGIDTMIAYMMGHLGITRLEMSHLLNLARNDSSVRSRLLYLEACDKRNKGTDIQLLQAVATEISQQRTRLNDWDLIRLLKEIPQSD